MLTTSLPYGIQESITIGMLTSQRSIIMEGNENIRLWNNQEAGSRIPSSVVPRGRLFEINTMCVGLNNCEYIDMCTRMDLVN